MKKLISSFYAKIKSIIPLRFRIWLGPYLFEYLDLVRFYIFKDRNKIQSLPVVEDHIRFLKYLGMEGIVFYRVNPIVKESILMSLKPYCTAIDRNKLFFSDKRDGKMLTLISRKWEVPRKKSRNMMEARDFLLTAGYFLRFPLEKMMASAIEAIALNFQSIVIVDTNPLAQEIYNYCRENCTESVKSEKLQIISGESELKYSAGKVCILDLPEEPDVVITCDLPLCRLQLQSAEKEPLFHLPFFYLLCGDATRYFDYRFEQDIINNILPELVKKDVRILIISNPQEGWMASLPFKHKEQAHIELVKRELEEADHQYFGENVNIRNVIGGRMVLRDHCLIFDDRDAQDIHWKDGESLTIGNNGKEKQDLYFFGPCFVWGNMCSDEKTIESYIRYMLGEQSNYAVHNCGCTWEWMPWMMRNKDYHQGDMVVIFAFNSQLYRRSGWQVIDISPAYRALGKDVVQNCWDQAFHINYRMNENIAKLVYENILIMETGNGRSR